MRRLLIVDDLPIIVDGLLELFQMTEHLGLEVLKAYSGEEALQVMRERPVDIVISDIKMPGLEGIELLQVIRADWPSCKVIFLTGYNDFHYIRSAMAYGGFDYILKVESDDKIIASVERALEKLEEERNQLRMLERANRRMREALPLLQKEYIWELLQGKQETPAELARHFEELGILLRVDRPVLLLLGRVDTWKESYTPMDKALLLYGVQNIAEEYAGAGMKCYSCVYENSRIIWLLQPWEGDEAKQEAWKAGCDHVGGMLEAIQQTCQRLLRVSVSFAISSEPTGLTAISERFHLLKYCFVHGLGLSPAVIVTDKDLLKLQNGGEEKNDYCHHARLQLLQRCLENKHREEFNKLYLHLTSIWTDDAQVYGRKMELYHSLAAIFLSIMEQNEDFRQDASKNMDTMLLYQKDEGISWPDVKQYFWSLADCYFAKHARQGEQVPSDLVKRVHRFIEEHLARDISLIAIAEHVGLNPSYLSRLYKQLTGIGLSDYINEYRNLKAKERLLNSTMKVGDIAAELGYNSALAFIRFFKKQNQATPQEYRLQRQAKEVNNSI
ncbi:response regulator [Paenibacillus sp. VCA1]|uniref:response regulator transcription factor n=1 Tax=Paenibacillus sp. VCA1 TaxID=3039148 RepID=UPI0028720457|nr:response regulator [Paenibacillus sp. VCA1]MDR9856786.1 response regulator [Paenibacillus sp. VCA1]